jgi:16S rRNA (guanine527-N7)-methyltransferase
MSRGLANISKSILMLRKVFVPNGVYFHFKSEGWASEVAEIPTALCSYWIPELVSDYMLPVGEVKFSIVKTIRTSKVD